MRERCKPDDLIHAWAIRARETTTRWSVELALNSPVPG